MDTYRKLWVDDQEGYTVVIQYKGIFGIWHTIKTMWSDDVSYLNTCSDEVLDALNMKL